MTNIVLERVRKQYGTTTILPELSLEVRHGEFLVIVGPSGCGKSTLLRMIAGLEPITAGDLMIGDQRANNLPPQKRNIAMVFQTYALFPHMTVRENIAFGPEVRNEPKAEIEPRIRRAAEVLNLTAYLDRRPAQLSGGQRQRVAMGRAIVRNPAAFLFDEPLSNLDAHLRVEMRTEIKALHQRLAATMIYVTHDQIEAMTMADRIVIMNHGRIEQIGTPMELYDHPANRFVASFLGSPAMSFFEGEITQRDGQSAVVGANGIHMPLDGGTHAAGTRVLAGVRPYDWRIAPDGPMQMQVDVVEPTGAETHATGQIGGQRVRCVFRNRERVEPGQTLRLEATPESIHLFNAEGTARL